MKNLRCSKCEKSKGELYVKDYTFLICKDCVEEENKKK